MPRAKGGYKTRQRRKRILKRTSGFRGAKSNRIRMASQALRRALRSATRGRKERKRQFRALWITRIGIAAKEHGISYSQLMGRLIKSGILINRKMLAELAVLNPKGFAAVVEAVKK